MSTVIDAPILKGKVALVTGASRGIGRDAAVALSKIGTAVAVNYKTRAQEAEAVCREIQDMGGLAVAIQADVSIGSEVTAMVRQVERQLGPVAVLLNNAGIARLQPFDQITERVWDEMLAVNLKSVVPSANHAVARGVSRFSSRFAVERPHGPSIRGEPH